MGIFSFLGGLVSPVTKYLTKRNNNKTKLRQQQIERITSAEDSAAELETILTESMRYSWKDEYWTVVLSIPAIACFVPITAQHIHQGFEVLATMPEFYQYWLGVCVLTSFGLRITK